MPSHNEVWFLLLFIFLLFLFFVLRGRRRRRNHPKGGYARIPNNITMILYCNISDPSLLRGLLTSTLPLFITASLPLLTNILSNYNYVTTDFSISFLIFPWRTGFYFWPVKVIPNTRYNQWKLKSESFPCIIYPFVLTRLTENTKRKLSSKIPV